MLCEESDFVQLKRADYEALLRELDERDDLVQLAKSEIEHLQTELAEQLRLNWRDAGYPAEVADRIMAGEAPLKALRETRRLTVNGLSEATGVNRTRIINLEDGKTNSTMLYLRKLAAYFGVAVDDILNR